MASSLETLLLAQVAYLQNTRPQLVSKTTLAASTASVTIGSIPQGFTNLRLVASAKSDGTGASGYDNASMQFNGITSANYNWTTWFMLQGGSSVSASGGTAAASMQCAAIWNSHFGSAGRGTATIDIPNYSDSNNCKQFTGQSTATDGGSIGVVQTYAGGTAFTSAITSITLLMNVGNFVADSTFTLYAM